MSSEDIIGYQVCGDAISNVVNHVTNWLRDENRDCRYFACLNPHSVEVAAADPAYKLALQAADFLTPDGIGVVYASKLLGGHIERRVTGADVFLGLSRAMNDAGGLSCFFLGSTEETLDTIVERMGKEFPALRVAGVYSPPFKPEFSEQDNQAMCDAINRVRPDVLWVGMTAPKQEKWIHDNQHRLQVKFAGPIGAVFDFYAGNVARVSSFWQNLGFEWLPRLLQEPRRLWRRSLVSAPRFVVRTLAYRIGRKSRPQGQQ